MVGVARHGDLGDPVAGEGLAAGDGGVLLHDRGPLLELGADLGVEGAAGVLEQGGYAAGVRARGLQLGRDVAQPLRAAGLLDELLGARVVAADGLDDLGEVAHPLLGDDRADAAGVLDVDGGQRALCHRQALLGEEAAQVLVERGDAVVVEGGRGGAEDRHVGRLLAEGLAVADQLATHVAQRVGGAAALELVDRHDVGEVEHVDLLQLRGGAELRRHDVHRGVDERHDRRVALADAGGLDDHEVEAGGLEDGDDVLEVVGDLVGAARGEAAEVDPVAVVAGQVEGVHPDAVAEQGAAALAAGRVDRDDRDAQLVLLVGAEAAQDLVGEAGLARAAGAGEAEHGRVAALGGRAELGAHVVVEAAELGAGDGPGDGGALAGQDLVDRDRAQVPQVGVAVGDDGVDHAGQAEALAVLGGEDRDAGLAQPGDLVVDDHAPAAADDPHVTGARGAQQLHEVLEVLHVPALVGRDRHALDVLLQRGVHDLLDRAVVAEVDHLAALALEDPPHDVDRGVVAVEQAARGDQADRVGGDVQAVHGALHRQMFGCPSIWVECKPGHHRPSRVVRGGVVPSRRINTPVRRGCRVEPAHRYAGSAGWGRAGRRVRGRRGRRRRRAGRPGGGSGRGPCRRRGRSRCR